MIRTGRLALLSMEIVPVAVAQAVAAGGLLAAVKLLTNMMPAYEYGLFALALTGSLLVSQTLHGPLAYAAQRFYAPAAEDGELRVFLSAVGFLAFVSSAFALALGVIGFVVLESMDFTSAAMLTIVACAFAVLNGWEVIIDSVLNAQRRRVAFGLHHAARQWLRPGLGVLILIVTGGGATAVLAGYALASCLILASQLRLEAGVIGRVDMRETADQRRRLLTFGGPFAMWGIFTWLHLASDRWAVAAAGGPAAAAGYAVAFQLGAQPLILLGTAAAQVIEPIIFAAAGSGADSRRVERAFRLTTNIAAASVGVLAVAVVFATIAHMELFALFASPEYASTSPYLPLAVLAGGLFSLGQFFAVGTVLSGSSRELLLPKLVTAVAGTLLNAWAAFAFGTPGVLASMAATALAYCLWTMQVGKHQLRKLSAH